MLIIDNAARARAYNALDRVVGPEPEITAYLAELLTRRPILARVIFAALWADVTLTDWKSR